METLTFQNFWQLSVCIWDALKEPFYDLFKMYCLIGREVTR